MAGSPNLEADDVQNNARASNSFSVTLPDIMREAESPARTKSSSNPLSGHLSSEDSQLNQTSRKKDLEGFPKLSILSGNPQSGNAGSLDGLANRNQTSIRKDLEGFPKLSLESSIADGSVKTNADSSTITTTSTASGKEVVARNSSGKESYRVGFDTNGKPNSIRDGNDWDWKSANGGNTFTAYRQGQPVDHDGKPVNDLRMATTWQGTVTIDDTGKLIQKDSNFTYERDANGTSSKRFPDGIVLISPNPDTSIKVNLDKTTITTTITADGKEVLAKDPLGNESYKVGFDKAGSINFVRSGANDWDWKSMDGGKTWYAVNSEQRKIWEGSVQIDAHDNLIETGKSKDSSRTIYTTKPNGIQQEKTDYSGGLSLSW